ncbi:MAG: nodulation protein NfeD [Halieaceae bacterium]|jgi:membrane-bound serine protease (ClpP class)|nr:nodulation protein NfeD [Halieaceae bacterium]
MPRLVRTLLLLLALTYSAMGTASSVWVLELRGAVGPGSADYLVRGMHQAAEADASLLILQIDTPGGLDGAMRQIIKAILASKVPVVSFVFPGGSRAASAGTYILYASHIAAMAPATNLGAATPVQIGAPSFPSVPGRDDDKDDGEQSIEPASAMERKVINDAVAYIQSLADLYGRNREWAEEAVREAASLSAREALDRNVVDLVAEDIDDLIDQLEGRSVKLGDEERTLVLGDPVYTHYQPDWRSEFLAVITDPNIAYILMMIGIYGLILEAYNPGTLVPGVVGAVCLLLALYAFQVLPISYAGLALIALGIMLMVAEAFAPSFGVMGLGGICAFILGSIILMDTELPAYQIALPLIMGIAVTSAALLALMLGMVVRARRQQVVSGVSMLEGQLAEVEALHDDRPMVRLQGELWEVDCRSSLSPGDVVRVITAEGVRLVVVKQTEKSS